MNDISIIDLFWLILKFLAALGLVCLLAFGLFLVWSAIKRLAQTTWSILNGRDVGVTATVCFAIVVVAVVSCVLAFCFPTLFH
jgi:hypothetical protein